MIHWDKCKDDFQWDGSLRGIYVTPASLGDWKALYSILCSYPNVEYFVDGVAQPPPADVEQVFAVWASANPMLRIRVGESVVIFHFFARDEIECDIDPREITSQADLDSLLGFVRQMGDVTRKPVAVTPENLPERPIITYEPEKGEFRYHEIAI